MRMISYKSFSHVNGGYQPAQILLQDRKGRAFGFDDVKHYHKIIKALVETDRIMKMLMSK
jgi:hypothetical protein